MFRSHEIHSLTDFQRNARVFIERLKQTGRPEVLTVNGKAEIVIQDAVAYQNLLDRLDRAEAVLGIQRGLLSVKRQEGEPMEEAFESLRKELGLGAGVEE